MQRIAILILALFVNLSVQSQNIARPKLVVGIVIDQMRWDYLYRYYDRYDPKGGFKRLLSQGFSCENTMIPYAPTVTACGHSSIYTGSVPAINGITGNFWWDREKMRSVYCSEDKSVNTVGTHSALGMMSPKNMLVTSICDELRLATNFKSKVIGIALKDRGGIFPAGHSANAAYWYDNTDGSWITSTYYMNELPAWVSNFNSQKNVDKYYQAGWSLLYPANTYTHSTADEKTYEGKPFGTKFPYDLKNFIGKDYLKIATTPMGNSLTTEFAKAAIIGEQLGADDVTDFLALSYSSPDYIGHTFGPNSVEEEDNYLRLDKELGGLLDFLDAKVGKNQYTIFLAADHGVAEVPEYLQENKLPSGRVVIANLTGQLNKIFNEKYKVNNIIVSNDNYQINLNNTAIDSAMLDKKDIVKLIVDSLTAFHGISRAFAVEDLNKVPLPARIREMLNNGYYPKRCGDIEYILKPDYIDASLPLATTHGVWNPYDAHIPLLWYGWGIKPGKLNREVYMTDIAPTVAALLHIQMPSGCIGKVIEEVIK